MKNHIDLKMPTAWNQLSRAQLLFVCRLFRLGLTEFNFKLRIFIRFTGITALPVRKVAGQVYYAFKKNGQVFYISIGELYSFIGSANFLMSDSQLTRNLFPGFYLLWKKFYGPSKNCFNITMLEFIHAEAALYRFSVSKDIKHLRTLCAILYRRQVKNYNPSAPGYTGDRREPFNDYTYQRRAKWFRLLHPNLVFAIYTFYAGCRSALMQKYPKVFEGSGSVSSEPVNPVDNLKNLVHSLTNGDVTKINQVEHTLLWDAVAHINSLITTNREAIKQIKKQSKK